MSRWPSSAVALLGILFSFLLACNPAALSPASETLSLTVHIVDVGQGDGILVQTSEGKAMVIDGGPRESGFADYLKRVGVQQVDVLVATNPDADHIGGLIQVVRDLPVKEVWLSGQEHTTATFERFLGAIEASRARVRAVRRGETYPLGSLQVQVLHPIEPFFSGRNNNSVVMKLSLGQQGFLFAGDAEKKAEESMLEAGLELRATVLKLGHHGSSTSTSPPFLAAVGPRIAVYQAAAGNQYGHPHRETIASLTQAGVTIYGTDRHGTIVMTTDGKNVQVKTER
ncbi:MAG: MBL fold metallo-hydrolase [Chloroflexi bacterium]|nr:MBL fold metallo-hydrolase [Chloroflexota bacterium]